MPSDTEQKRTLVSFQSLPMAVLVGLRLVLIQFRLKFWGKTFGGEDDAPIRYR